MFGAVNVKVMVFKNERTNPIVTVRNEPNWLKDKYSKNKVL